MKYKNEKPAASIAEMRAGMAGEDLLANRRRLNEGASA
jgi:hypothetical protein